MVKRLFLFLCLWNTACAELPPVTGSGGSVSAPDPAAASPPPASASTLFELNKRIEQMHAEVQQLTGKVEEQAYQIEELKKQQKTMFKDFDDRLLSIENNGASPKPAVPAESSAPAPETGPVPAIVSPSAGTPEGASRVSPPSEAAASEAAPVPAPAAPPLTEAEKQDYQKAYNSLRNGQTNESIAQFNAYLVNHPGSAYAGNAKYWLGEGYRVNLNNAEAKKAFNEVVQNYPGSAKVPDALFKLGTIEAEEKNVDKAREYYTRITTEFASSRAAGLASKRLQALDGAAP